MSGLYPSPFGNRRPSNAELQAQRRRANQGPSVTAAQEAADEARAYAEGMILVGMVVAWDGDGDPSEKWMIRDGRLLESSSYPDLFAVLGTRHNLGGEAAGQFRLPDARGRALVGAGQGSGFTNRPLGSRFGAETHALTVAQMPSHNHGNDADQNNGQTSAYTHDHGTSQDAHHHTGDTFVSSAPQSRATPDGAGRLFVESVGLSEGTVNSYSHVHDIDNDTHHHIITAQGGGAAHNNLQPSLATNTVVRCLP